MSVARFVADQRTNYRVPHATTCRLLEVSQSWFYKWHGRATGVSAASGPHTGRDRRRDTIDRAMKVVFNQVKGLHGSPRLHLDLRDDGWQVSEKTVAESMRRQGLVARKIKRRSGLTRQDKTAAKFPDLLRRNFTADRANVKWVGDITEIPTGADGRGPKLYLATVIALYSRRLLGAATSLHPDADLACTAIRMAVTHPAHRLPNPQPAAQAGEPVGGVGRSAVGVEDDAGGRVLAAAGWGSCFDNAAAEAFFSTLEWEVLSRHEFATTQQAAPPPCSNGATAFYNHRRRHTATGMISPINYENTAATIPVAA